MSTFKKLTEVCAVEMMVGLGFLITGILCLATGAYDGALVCSVVAVVAGILARMRWVRPAENESRAVYVATPVPAKPRKVVKSKKKPRVKKKPAGRK